MGIEQNFNRNLKKAVKKQQHNLPPDNKFIFQQLLKNSHHIEENLEDETEYNVGNLKEVINNLREQASYQEFNDIGIYGDVGPAYTFKSQGPIPGGYTERGYNFESDGPLGVDYFNEETELEEKVTGGGEEDCVAPDWWSAILGQCMDGSKSGGGKTVGGNGKKEKAGNKKFKVGDLREVIKNLSEEIVTESQLLTEEKCGGSCSYSYDQCPNGDDSGAKEWTVHGSTGMYGSTSCAEFMVSACAAHCGRPSGESVAHIPIKRNKRDIDSLYADNKKQETREATTTSSSGAYSTPKFWAKNKKNHRFGKKRWMPGAQFVKVKDKCKKFPYCNQGDISALELWEKNIMRESAKKVSKKTGLPEKEVRNRIEKEIKEIIRRSFYKSPVKDLVGTGKMNTPIGKMFTMKGNKPKYES